MRRFTFSSPPTPTLTELASCPRRINKGKDRGVTSDGYGVNGHTYSLRRFLKITLTLLTAQVPSLIAQEWAHHLLQKVGKESDAPQGGAHSEET